MSVLTTLNHNKELWKNVKRRNILKIFPVAITEIIKQSYCKIILLSRAFFFASIHNITTLQIKISGQNICWKNHPDILELNGLNLNMKINLKKNTEIHKKRQVYKNSGIYGILTNSEAPTYSGVLSNILSISSCKLSTCSIASSFSMSSINDNPVGVGPVATEILALRIWRTRGSPAIPELSEPRLGLRGRVSSVYCKKQQIHVLAVVVNFLVPWSNFS